MFSQVGEAVGWSRGGQRSLRLARPVCPRGCGWARGQGESTEHRQSRKEDFPVSSPEMRVGQSEVHHVGKQLGGDVNLGAGAHGGGLEGWVSQDPH